MQHPLGPLRDRAACANVRRTTPSRQQRYAVPVSQAKMAHRTFMLNAACICTAEDLEQIAAEWLELFQRVGCRNPFISVEWMASWWRHWGRHHRLLIVVVRNEVGRLVAVAPFFIRMSWLGGWGPRALCLVGSHSIVRSFHLDILLDPLYEAQAIDTVTSVVLEHRPKWDYIELQGINDTSPGLARLCNRLASIGLTEKVIRTQTTECPYATLPRSFEGYLESLGANVRYNFRRRRRALVRQGVEFVTVTGKSELHKKFDDLFRLHRLRFDDKQELSDFLRSDARAFHVDALERLAEARMASLFFLQVDGKPIAALYGFSTGKTFSFYQAGMDPAWSRLSAGLVLLGCSIEEAIRTGHDEFDFLGGPNPYKFQWAHKVRDDVMICLFDRRPASLQARSLIAIIDRMRNLKRRCYAGYENYFRREQRV